MIITGKPLMKGKRCDVGVLHFFFRFVEYPRLILQKTNRQNYIDYTSNSVSNPVIPLKELYVS
jgi:hypothetical protein